MMASHTLVRPWRRLRIWYRASMVNRVMLLAMTLVLALLVVGGVIAYASMESALSETIRRQLAYSAESRRDRMQDRLSQAIIEAESLARQTLVSSGLDDTLGRGVYLRPYFREQIEQHPEVAEVTLFDWTGVALVSSGEHPKSRPGLIAEVVSSELPVKWLLVTGSDTRLLIGAPVRAARTRTVEGVLISEIRLDHLAQSILGTSEASVGLKLMSGQRVLFGSLAKADGPMLEQSATLAGSPDLTPLALSIVASMPVGVAEAPLTRLKFSFLMLGFIAVSATFFGARTLSRRVIDPLATLSQHAQEIASEGASGLREVEVRGHDEVGWLAMAFNSMVRSLRQAYIELESRVQERTRALETRELYLRAILDNFPFMIWLKDEESRFLAANEVMAKTVGVDSPNRMVGLTDLDIWPHELARSYRADDRAVMDQRAEKVVEEAIVESGKRHWYETYKKPVIDAAGQVLGTVGFCRDITERRESEAAMRLRDRALTSSSDGIVITDMTLPGQPIIYVNPAFERITGYTFDEVCGRNCNFLQGDERDQAGLSELRQAVHEGRECRVVLRNYRKDGTLFWNQLTISPVRDDSGRVTHYVGIQNDMTQSMEAARALGESERRLSMTLDALRDGLWDWNIQDGSLYQSPSWARMLGYEPEDMTGDLASFGRCLRDEDAEQVWQAIDSHLRGEAPIFICEHRMIRKDGEEIWVSDRGRVVEWSPDGQPVRMVGTITDISARYRMERDLMSWMQRLDTILTLSPDAYVYFGTDQRIASVNLAFERMTGLLSGDVHGLSYMELIERLSMLADPTEAFPPLGELFDAASRGDAIDATAESGRTRPHLYLRKPTHRVLAYELRYNENDRSAVLFLGDVTRETEVDRMKSEFLSTAAHELRTPMASIMGFSELLMRRAYDADTARDLLETIHRQAKRLTDLLNELLDLARIEARAGKDFKFSLQSLLPLVREATTTAIGGSARTIRLDIGESIALTRMDPAKIQQALLNILSNAFKYSPNGEEVVVTLSEIEGPDGLPRVTLAVRDHGIGMTPEQTARVFERFFRADPSGNIPGTGLGMALVKEIVELHGGGVSIESQPSEGTTVTLWLPVANAELGALAA